MKKENTQLVYDEMIGKFFVFDYMECVYQPEHFLNIHINEEYNKPTLSINKPTNEIKFLNKNLKCGK